MQLVGFRVMKAPMVQARRATVFSDLRRLQAVLQGIVGVSSIFKHIRSFD